jgi:plasmid maintenance system antidote protein VapI
VEGETGSCNETCVTCDVDGTEEVSIKFEDTIDIKEEVSMKVEDTVDIKKEVSIKVNDTIDIKEEVSIKVEDTIDIKEEVSIKVEEAIDVKDEIPEAVTFSPSMTEHEVRLRHVCEVVAANVFRAFIAPKKKL